MKIKVISLFFLLALVCLGYYFSTEIFNYSQKDEKLQHTYTPGEKSENHLTIAAGLTVEPYIFPEKDKGFEIDIIREILNSEGYRVNFLYQPLQRTKISFRQNCVDGVMTIKKHYPEIKGAFLSNFYIEYQNFAYSLGSKNLKINSIDDLADKRVIAFQQARLAFGRKFMLMTKNNRKYLEMANQKNQITMLFLNRTDVIILDDKIFKYYRKNIKNIPPDSRVKKHRLFPPSRFRMAFRKKSVRDAFNRGLKKLKRTGRYRAIINSYGDLL